MEEGRYPIARELIARHFGSLNKFIKAAGLPRTTVIRVLNGRYGADDGQQRQRIEAALGRLGIPERKLKSLWARIQDEASGQVVVMNGRKLKLTTMVVIEDLGPGKE
jgi:hypothetical protein